MNNTSSTNVTQDKRWPTPIFQAIHSGFMLMEARMRAGYTLTTWPGQTEWVALVKHYIDHDAANVTLALADDFTLLRDISQALKLKLEQEDQVNSVQQLASLRIWSEISERVFQYLDPK